MKTKTFDLFSQIRYIRKMQDAFTLIDIMVGIIVVGLIGGIAMSILSSTLPKTTKAKQAATPSPSASAPAADPAPATQSVPAAHAAQAEFPWGIVLGIGVTAILAVAFIALIVWFIRTNKAASVKSKNNIAGWEKLISRHRELRTQWASYEIDMAKLIDFPLMTDMREPVIIALHKALKKAAALEPENAKKMSGQPVIESDFWNAVNELDAAFHTAEHTAKKVAWGRFTPEERKSLSTAKNLLALAMDSGASPSERQAAYKRVFKELQGLIEFPEAARLEIEARHQLAIAA